MKVRDLKLMLSSLQDDDDIEIVGKIQRRLLQYFRSTYNIRLIHRENDTSKFYLEIEGKCGGSIKVGDVKK